jgi:predicted aldo/keto reductase-like oxidoreductase
MDSVPNLPTRRLGKTGLEVTTVGFGGIPIQPVPEEDAVATIRRAYDLGVNFFDTARGYTNSEERIGKALEGRKYIVATKSGARDARGAYDDVKRSLGNLRRRQIDLYQLHGVNDDELLGEVLAPGGALEGLRRARDEGDIAHIGITGHRRETLIRAVEQCDDFSTVQVPFNFVEDEILQALLPLCLERDVGVIAMKPVGGGNFTNPPLVIKWCLNHPISAAIPGMASVHEVEADVAVAHGHTDLSPEERSELEQMRSQLDQRTCRRCRYCEPCPNGVQIMMLMHGRTIIKRMGATRFFEDFGGPEIIASAANCVECGVCIEKCPYQLPIPELIREAVEYYRDVLDLPPPREP